jgi:methylmalonyl-CoA epimerase
MSLVHQIDHIAFVVNDIAETSKFFVDFLGLTVSPSEEVPEQGVRVAFVQLGEVRIELVQPLGPETPVGKFIAKRGQGLHHVAMRTHDVAAALAELKSKDFPLIDQNPKVGAHGALIAFLNPKGTSGVLTELCQPVEH